jgi:hypothetical protein
VNKKEAERTSLIWFVPPGACAPISESFLLLFSKKEVLAALPSLPASPVPRAKPVP